MSAHDQNVRPHDNINTDLGDQSVSVNERPDSHAYYAVLAERLEKLLFDMQQRGVASDDALMLRLADLLSETRGLLRKNKSA